MASAPLTIPVLHFNDVYKMTRSVKKPEGTRLTDDSGRLHEKFDHVIGLSRKIEEVRDSWADENREGLLLFSGDLFSPSVESTLTEGRNMVHLMNELAPDACVPGNHEFDFRRERFNQLVESSNFPWVLSNAEEQTKDGWTTLKYLKRYSVLEAGPDEQKLRIGIIGLMSEDTFKKIDGTATSTFRLSEPNSDANNEMKNKCMKLAAELRGEPEKCDLVFALTHALFEEDIDLGKQVNCYTADVFRKLGKGKLEDTPGVDLILGGHDHDYFLGKGVKLTETTRPEGDTTAQGDTQGPFESDDGLLIIKSGTDFQDLNEIEITVRDGNEQVRRKVIESVKVKRHCHPDNTCKDAGGKTPRKCRMANVLQRIFKHQVAGEMKKPVAQLPPGVSASILTNNNQASRREETVLGNWIADSMIRWYSNHRTKKMEHLSDLIFITTGGSIRSGSEVDPNKVLQGEIVQLSPFTTSLVTIKTTGKVLRDTLELALQASNKDPSNPTTHVPVGSFPLVAGIKVEWDSTKPVGERVCSLTLSSGAAVIQDEEHFYNILTHTYLSGGGDGLTPLKEHTELVDSEVTMYKALLTDISDTSIEDAHALLQQQSAPEIASTRDLGDSIPALPVELYSMFPIAALFPILATVLAFEDRPSLVAEKAMDRVVEITREKKLPVLKIPVQVDGRMRDISIPS